MTRIRRTLAVVVGVAALVAGGACSGRDSTGTTAGTGSGGGTGTTAVLEAPVDYSQPGPYRVGLMTITAGSTTAIVLYPADGAALAGVRHVTSYSSGDAFAPDLRSVVAGLVPEFVQDIPIDAYDRAPINPEGPFPAVIHSHGFGGFNELASQHFQHEASWGFVVAAPDHRSRDLTAVATGQLKVDGDPDVQDLRDTLAALAAENRRQGSPLYDGVDTTKVGAEGHSAGGRASYLFATTTPAVKTWIGQAPSAPIAFEAGDQGLSPEEALAKEKAALLQAPALGKPAVILEGEKDSVVPLAGVQALYDWLLPPKRMIVVANAGHASFLDVCKPVRDLGGLQKYGEQLPAFAPLLKLGDDGCGADNIDPVRATALVNHVMVAQYRYAFGEDRTDVSLSDAYLRRQFPVAFGGQQSDQG